MQVTIQYKIVTLLFNLLLLVALGVNANKKPENSPFCI